MELTLTDASPTLRILAWRNFRQLRHLFTLTSFLSPSFLLSAVQQRLRPGVRLQQSELPERVLPAQRCLQAAVWSAYYVRRGLSCWYVHLHYGAYTCTQLDACTLTLAGVPIPLRYIHLHRVNPEEGYTHWTFPAHFSAGTRIIQCQCKASLMEVWILYTQ